jgi:predicted regulator of Ras-like GTPase activity (Roadblock/LC7/MglB family)
MHDAQGGTLITSENQHRAPQTRLTYFEDVLQRMSRLSDFQAAVLANSEGLPIATASPGQDPNATAAMVALLQRVSKEARGQLGLGEIDEVTILDRERVRLVCRHLALDGEELILAVTVAPHRRHRRATNWAIRALEGAWKARAE